MKHERSWYITLPNRARHYMYMSHLTVHESKDRTQVAEDLKDAMLELLEENEKKAAEITRLQGILENAGIAF